MQLHSSLFSVRSLTINYNSSTPSSSTIFALHVLIDSHKKGGSERQTPSFSFKFRVLGLVSQAEYDIICFSV